MTKREGELKSAVMEELKRQLPNFLVLQIATAGAADRAIVGAGRTTFWEFKHGTPNFESLGLQQLMCMRLDAQCYCRYVIWEENKFGQCKRTIIVHPKYISTFGKADSVSILEAWCVGFDHRWLVEQIKQAHRL